MPVIYLSERVARKTKGETGILRAVRDYLRLRGWFVIRMQQGLGCHKGISDLVAVKEGMTLWIEVKTARGKLSKHQERFREQITDSGCIYVVVRGVEDIIEIEKSIAPPLQNKKGRNDKSVNTNN